MENKEKWLDLGFSMIPIIAGKRKINDFLKLLQAISVISNMLGGFLGEKENQNIFNK